MTLYRGINSDNEGNTGITSWSYDKEIAKGYAGKNGKVISKEVNPDEILIDTTKVPEEMRKSIGYDWKVDDKEVLLLRTI